MSEYRVAVRELARFCFRSGDIDHRFTPSPSAREGIEGHQRIYSRRGDDYRPEYPVAWREEVDGLTLVLAGRADGYDAGAALVEEIKTCRVDPAAIPAAVSQLHLAQARLYAALIARAEDLPGMRVRLTWLHVDEDREYPLSQDYSRAELEDFLEGALAHFGQWLRAVDARRRARDASLQALAFPFAAFRSGQREIAERVYKCIAGGGELLVEAPTGIGKTAAVLYPALKALGTGRHERVVFCTAKTSGRLAAEQTLAHLGARGYAGKALTLSARERVCLSPGKACHGDDCPYARGYYERLPAAMNDALQRPRLQREDLERLAREHEVCPYELAWDLLPWIDTVIADVHYVYSLTASLAERLQAAGLRTTVLLDEAHNLPSRARAMFGASLDRRALLAVQKQLPRGDPVQRSLAALNRQWLALEKIDWVAPDWDSREALPEALQQSLQRFVSLMGERLAREPLALARASDLLAFYFDVLQVLRSAEQWGPEFRFELQREAPGKPSRLRLNCLDPSRLLGQRQQAAQAVVAFSATLSPWPWAREQLGLSGGTVCYRAASPFRPEQLQVDLATGIDTRFQQRSASLPALARRLQDWLAAEPGNCLLYFPSYRYLQDCLALLPQPLPARTLWVQERGADEAARDALLGLLAERRDVAALCILGGVLGEGIDLPGERLHSVVVVGVGLPQVNRDSRAQQDFFERQYGDGFAYAFQYPGMQKVSQALGRVIRGDADHGRALLVDTRYAQPAYRRLLPPWWAYRQDAG